MRAFWRQWHALMLGARRSAVPVHHAIAV
jgi:hypothetical protein